MRHSEDGLYQALEKVLRATGKPMECNQLYDLAEIKEHAPSVNRVSDYLGGLWRKGLVSRWPAAGGDKPRARWAYQWKVSDSPSTGTGAGADYVPRLLVDRPTVMITEEGRTIQLVMPNLTIILKQTSIYPRMMTR